MSNDFEGSMWRNHPASSSSRLASLKSLVPASQREALRTFFGRRIPTSADGQRTLGTPGEERKQSWREWAGDRVRRRGTGSSMSSAVEKVSLFPGWVARRYHSGEMEGEQAAEFSLEIFVSGFAASYVPLESATRSQRAFMRLAKAYASLPKLPSSDPQTPTEGVSTVKLSSSTEDLLKPVYLPPTPGEITEESELLALERQFCRAERGSEAGSLSSTDSRSSSPKVVLSPSTRASTQVSYTSASPQFSCAPADLVRLHANLSARLQPFWSRSLPNRTLRLSVYSASPRASSFMPDDYEPNDPVRAPIFVQETTTSAQGAFEIKIRVPWERICVHPGALHIAFGEASEEAELFVCAELFPPMKPTTPNSPIAPSAAVAAQEPTTHCVLSFPVTHSEVRLISDIDDTIKLSNILGGARAVFRNVFVKHLEETVIKGMGEWYTSMWLRGVRFHYVSNSPFELLPVINEFINVSSLPRGSIRLRSYAGRSLFNGLLSAPAARKKDGILDVLNAFSGARFFLVGDTGEQDLELYAQLAAERHGQILAVFVRNASAEVDPLDDPTGEGIKHQRRRAASYASGMPLPALPSVTNPPPLSPLAETPTQRNFFQAEPSTRHGNMRRPYIDTSTQNYATAISPAASTSHPRIPGAVLRSPSEPTPGMGMPSTFFDSGLGHIPSPDTSFPSPRFPSVSGGLHFSGSLSKAEIVNISPAERRRYELQERVYRARLFMPSHIPLRIFTNPEECVEADRILGELAGKRRSGE